MKIKEEWVSSSKIDKTKYISMYKDSIEVDKIIRNEHSYFMNCRFNQANFKEAYIGSGFPNKSLMGMREVINPFTADFDDEGDGAKASQKNKSETFSKQEKLTAKENLVNTSVSSGVAASKRRRRRRNY